MRTLVVILFVFSLVTSCRKSGEDINFPDSSQAYYMDLQGQEIKMNMHTALDLNRDGEKDISFGTILVGDPVFGVDKRQYVVSTGINSFLSVDQDEKIPVLQAGDSIPVENFRGYNWYNATYIVLARKITGVDKPSYWEGSWKDARHNYIALQLKNRNLRYNGWVEISFDMAAEKIILHRACLSKQPEKSLICDKNWK
jgi:hypothetical protein